jgi:hypothetical protein
LHYNKTTAPTILPSLSSTLKPTVLSNCFQWVLGYTSESCSQTCNRINSVCQESYLQTITNRASFIAMVNSSLYLYSGEIIGNATKFCNRGINNHNFSNSPSSLSFVSITPSGRKLDIFCYYPTTLDILATCDTFYINPPTQRFCSCVSSSCSTNVPTSIPSSIPTSKPSSIPLSFPTSKPSSIPSFPTKKPTSIPSSIPTKKPLIPSSIPTVKLSSKPTLLPTVAGKSIILTSNYTIDTFISLSFLNPTSVWLDSKQKFYITYSSSEIVTIVDKNGFNRTFVGQNRATALLSTSSNGDGGLAQSALLNNPYSVVEDVYGNIFFSDQNSNKIRKVSTTTNIISTFVGTGSYGFHGDGGSSTAATLSHPSCIWINTFKNRLFITDTFNHRIRGVDLSSSTIVTVAGSGVSAPSDGSFAGDGGAATSAKLRQPAGVWSGDSAGSIYIADTYNHRIRLVDGSSGIIRTIVGNGIAAYNGDGIASTSASLNYPSGVWIDSFGNIFIADTFNSLLRVVSKQTLRINTLAGASGQNGYSGDGMLSVNALLNKPLNVIGDTDGNLYVSDSSNNVVRKLTYF